MTHKFWFWNWMKSKNIRLERNNKQETFNFQIKICFYINSTNMFNYILCNTKVLAIKLYRNLNTGDSKIKEKNLKANPKAKLEIKKMTVKIKTDRKKKFIVFISGLKNPRYK